LGAPSHGAARVRSRALVINLTGKQIAAHGVSVASGELKTVSIVEGTLPGISADSTGNLFFAAQSKNQVLKLDAAGRVTTLAGTGRAGDSGDYGAAVQARLDRPFDVKAGPAGHVYISDAGNGRVSVVDEAGVIRPAPGNGIGLTWTCSPAGGFKGGAEAAALVTRLGGPASVATDTLGNVYFALALANQIKRLEPSGAITTVAGALVRDRSCPPGQACPGFGGDGGPAVRARLSFPTAVATSPRGDLYILDSGNSRVRFINLGAKPVTVHGVRAGGGTGSLLGGRGWVL